MRMRRAARVVAVSGLVALGSLSFGSAAWADTELTLRQSNVKAAEFENKSCGQIPGGAATAGKDGWVFVLPSQDGEFTSLTLTFDTGSETKIVKIEDSSDPYPDDILSDAKGTSKAYVITPAGWTLVSGTATSVGTPPQDNKFNLTHVCVGTGGSQSPSTSVPPSRSVPPSSAAAPSSPGAPGGGGSLPITGASVTVLVVLGLGLVAGGTALVVVRRRRTTFTAE